jgi:hypothetical protein
MKKWLPKEIIEMDEFLPENLKKLRNNVKKARGDDISFELHVFEERVIFSDDSNQKLPWSIIGAYEDHYSAKIYRIEPRHVKKLFLQGWMEVMAWERGERQDQVFYPVPKNIQQLACTDDGQFFHGESTLFSIDCMNTYLKKYLYQQPKKRQKRIRFINLRRSRSLNTNWHVFVDQKLWHYYYDTNERINELFNGKFPPIGEMSSLNCSKKSEACHATIANFDSWQSFLHRLHTKKGDIMNNENSILGRIETMKHNAANDPTQISPDISKMIDRLEKMRISELNQNEQKMITNAATISPKIQLEIRKAQLRFIQSQLRMAYYDYIEELQKPHFTDKIKKSFQSISWKCQSALCPETKPIVKRPLTWVPVPVCLLLICIFYLFMIDQPLLDQSYQIARSMGHPIKYIDVRGKERAFAPSNDDQHVYQAFQAGVWQGQHQLIQQESTSIVPDHLYPDSQKNSLESWEKFPEFSFYYNTAKFCYLTYSSHESGLTFPSSFWNIQLQIINALITDYQTNARQTEKDRAMISESLHKIQSILKQSDHFNLTKREYRHIRNEAFRLISHFN